MLVQAITINTNSWTNAGHAVNQIYDILYMMSRDDIDVGVGGDGGILKNGTIQPNVGGYIPIIDQGRGTSGPCRYRQSIPVISGGRLDIDTNFGFRRSFLPQGSRRYSPLRQPTSQEVLIKAISKGPINVFITGIHTNLGILLMKNPHLKKNIKHIYIMGGGVRSKNPTGCCPKNATSSCIPQQCGNHGNMFTTFRSNPYAEFNFFGDPFAAYQVIHSGIPITLVGLDATNTIPITKEFFETFENNQRTYEAQYIFKSLKMARDTWFDDQFFTSYFMWDSFMSGVATSAIRSIHNGEEENEFAEMEYINITVITSNQPYGISDGSNTIFNGQKIPKFGLAKNGVHSGHVQIGIHDPFCLRENGAGICKDGYTEEVTGPDSVRVHVATRAKANVDNTSALDREYFVSFLDAILVTGSGWANAATIDVVYDLLHMMGRDDVVVGLDSDTLYGLARDLPRSPRRYTAENSVEFGAPRNTDFPQLRQPVALEVWRSLVKSIDDGSKITVLTNGPLTNLANILLSDTNSSSIIEEVVILGGHINYNKNQDKGNVVNVPSNKYAELNMFLDPLAAKTVFESSLDITLIPLSMQRKVSVIPKILNRLQTKNTTPEAIFTRRLLMRLRRLQKKSHLYRHVDMFLGEILGVLVVASDPNILKPTFEIEHLMVYAQGNVSKDGEIMVDTNKTKGIKVLKDFNHVSCYDIFANHLTDRKQSAVIGSFNEQKKLWGSLEK
ncbi:inosine-uridine preferring nucleoside hydrolase [Tanacetum coccineum]